MNALSESPRESAAVMAAQDWRDRRAAQRLFPESRGFPVVVLLAVAVIVFSVLKPMRETPYAPGIGVRVGASALALVASAWVVAWVVAHSLRPVFRAVAGATIAVTALLVVWTAVIMASPLAGPVGRPDDPAYLGERFEIVVREGLGSNRNAVVSGSVLAVQEVAFEHPFSTSEAPYFDYYADGRCWAVQVELVSRFDARLVDPARDIDSVPRFRPTVSLSTPDGSQVEASAWDNTNCEIFSAGRATSNHYQTPSPDAGLTIYTFWVTLAIPSNELPSQVQLTVNNSAQRSFYVPELAPGGCGVYDDMCGGLLTLENRARLQRGLQGHVDYYWQRAVECSPPNEPDEYCAG